MIPTNKTTENENKDIKNGEDLIDDLDIGEDEDFEISNYGGGNAEDDLFDKIVGSLQDIVLEEEFEILQRTFLDENSEVFEDTEENKMEYWEIFKAYQKKIENFLEAKLKERIPDLNMKKFFEMLTSRGEEVDSQLLDTLLSFTDFPQFKELMLDHLRFKKKTSKAKPKKRKAVGDKKESLPQTENPKEKEKKKKFEPSLDEQFSQLLICTPARSQLGTNKKKEKTVTTDDNIFAVKSDRTQPLGIHPMKKGPF